MSLPIDILIFKLDAEIKTNGPHISEPELHQLEKALKWARAEKGIHEQANAARWKDVEPIPEDTPTLEQAKAVVQAAAKRLANCTREEAVIDVWTAAINNIIQDELVKFMDWMFNKRDRIITGLVEDSYAPSDQILLGDRDTINMLVSEFTAYRKPV